MAPQTIRFSSSDIDAPPTQPVSFSVSDIEQPAEPSIQVPQRAPTANSAIARDAEQQLQRTDLPESVRSELEAIRAGTAEQGHVLGNATAALTPANVAMGAGLVVSPLVGGMSAVPAMAAVGAAGGAGSLVGSGVQALAGKPTTAAQVGKDAALNAALQAGGEGLGRGTAAVAQKASRFLMNRAANVSERLNREFPELSQTLIDNAISVSQGGYDKARGMLMKAKAAANFALDKAAQAGATVPVELTPEIADSFKAAIVEQAMKTGTAPLAAGQPVNIATARLDAPTKQLLASIDAAVANGTALDVSPRLADMLKSQLQREVKNSVYAARMNPNGAPAIKQAAALKAEYASRLNDVIDGLTQGVYKQANAAAQEMIGAMRAVRQAVRPGKNLYMAMVRPTTGAVLGSIAGQAEGHPGYGAAIGGALSTPGMMSREAIALGHPVIQKLLMQLPKPLAAAISTYLSEGSPSTPEPSGQ